MKYMAKLRLNQVLDCVVLEYLVMESLTPAKNMLYLKLVTMLSFREMNSDYNEGGNCYHVNKGGPKHEQ